MKINNEEIEVIITRKRMKGIRMKVENKKVLITAGPFYSSETIRQFVCQKQDWIEKQLHTNKTIISNNLERIVIFNQEYPIRMIQGKPTVYLSENEVILATSPNATEQSKLLMLKKFRQQLLSQFLESKRTEVEQTTGKLQVSYHYRLMSSRFGSCMYKKDLITFNLHLISLSPELILSVVYHEYAHFLQPNHSAKFYQVLAHYDQDYRQHRLELNNYVFTK